MEDNLSPAAQLFVNAYCELSEIPEYRGEINYVTTLISRGPQAMTAFQFFRQYVFVVLCSYWKEQCARREWDRYFETGDIRVISNRRKREAVHLGWHNFENWFWRWKESGWDIEFLETLPMIGPVTKYHLARNCGCDCAKPDRHLIRLARELGYGTSKDIREQTKFVNKMCEDIKREIGGIEFVGVIDVVLWRYCSIHSTKC
jgi:hypothetical protein